MRIALIATCLGDALFPEVAKATTVLLERLGHQVVFPADQVCCGQMHVNTGYLTEAVPVVRCRRSPPRPLEAAAVQVPPARELARVEAPGQGRGRVLRRRVRRLRSWSARRS